jgi:phosphatidylserine/phosphatidylglycerophosphate/cardiolipin synthase-like enzyme
MRLIILLKPVLLVLLLNACAGVPERDCPPGTQALPDCPPADAVNDEKVNADYEHRTWLPPSKLDFDPVKAGDEASVPVNNARAKIIGPTYQDSLTSLATKIWLIENAQHTIDATYYIFHKDHVGNALLGAMCNAVKRGVDVRLMVDSLGSYSAEHTPLRALEACAENAGFMRNDKGQVTTKKARVQVVIFNAFSKFNFNRRSHDKLLVIDGAYADKAVVMTGGRNISLDYYGIKEDGTKDPTAFRDLEILLRPGLNKSDEDITVGDVSERYYTIVFLYKGNKRIWPRLGDEFAEGTYEDRYIKHRKKAQDDLAFIKSLPDVKKVLDDMPRFMAEDFHDAKVRLAHQLSNLTNYEVTTRALENIELNPNSISYLYEKLVQKRMEEGITGGVTLRIVSPYLFAGVYKNEEGEVVYDDVKNVHEFLKDNPDVKIEIITNSVLTSDNFFTQAVIDMEMAPRLLLSLEQQEQWLSDTEDGEFNPELVESEEWKKRINHPQIFIYETGGLDSVELGGETYYGKLHAKFIIGERTGFVGTSNFDYRSILYNNEMGFFYQSDAVRDDMVEIFELLKSTSLRWGTPEWLEMRRKTMESDSKKAGPARKQRGTYKTIENLDLKNLM